MASEADHLALANANHEMLMHLLPDASQFSAWIVTVAFYKAVHVVEAAFAHHMRRHSTSHDNREKTLKTPAYANIWRNYSHLYTASRIARYLEDRREGKFTTFADYMDVEAVKKPLRKRLYGVEQNAVAFLSDVGKATLRKVNTTDIR